MVTDPCLEARQRMVEEQIRARGVVDERVLRLMAEIPRERFIPAAEQHGAFSDRAVPLECGQTVSQPFMVAVMTEYLDVEPEHRVLEIGTGSGYQTAILARLAREVYTIERLPLLRQQAQTLLNSLDIGNVIYRTGDGSLGWPEMAPFDRIMVTAAAPDVPKSLIEQLAEGGRMVIPVGQEGEQTLTLVHCSAGRIEETPRFLCRFVKLIGREAWSQ
ncbi:MAG: protein-L-isoaspartate(D-aspartate) O-methyltransferase [Phycisphaerae bacterium]|nr:protein-L-isoaspartate(D-aspartate) O-methyltransferase [Phycisphaerae bacterium]